MEPLPENDIAEAVLEMVERLRVLHDLPLDLPVHPFFATLGHHPDLTVSFLDLGLKFLHQTKLSPRYRELAILRTAWLCGAPYEWGEHVFKGKDAGLTSEEIERITQGSSAPEWGDQERSILAAVEELHRDAMISDATWEALSAWLDEPQLIELPMLVGHYHKVAFVQNTLRFRTREDNTGLLAR
jgi:alkylhydroperoxidase family enzyme